MKRFIPNTIRIHLAILLAVMAVTPLVDAQNLIPNPSFEVYSSIPTSYGQMSLATPWYNVNGSGDYFHSSTGMAGIDIPSNYFGNQPARTGNAYAGIAYSSSNSYHEFIGVPLISPLTVGQSYYFEIYVSAGEGPYMYGTNNLGIYTSTSALSGVPAVTPNFNHTSVITDYTNWVLVSGTFTATLAASHLTIGNFFSPAATTWVNLGTGGAIGSQYWYFEDAVLQPVILPDQDLQIRADARLDGFAEISWKVPSELGLKRYTIQRSIDGGAQFTEVGTAEVSGASEYFFSDHPGNTGLTYVYRIKAVLDDGSVRFSPSASVTMSFAGLKELVSIYPNPVLGSKGPSYLRLPVVQLGTVTVEILDVVGHVQQQFNVDATGGMLDVVLPQGILPAGTYMLKITSGKDSAVLPWMIME